MLEGDYWETENSYTILMYYKAFNDRADQLIGVAQIDSRTDRPGFSFWYWILDAGSGVAKYDQISFVRKFYFTIIYCW